MFDECIEAFRPREVCGEKPDKSYSYIVLPFQLTTKWDLYICKVHPTERVHLFNTHGAFISKVENPVWIDQFQKHLFGIALAAIISFITQRNTRAPRDVHYVSLKDDMLSEDEIKEIGMCNPVKYGGPGAQQTYLASSKISRMETELKDFILMLHAIPIEDYQQVMRGVRLVSLSINNKRDDFGLAYYLVVSAIEHMAQCAISKESVATLPNQEWLEKAKSDKTFKELLDTYMQGKNSHYLQKRYLKFILTYAKKENWLDYVQHPYQDSFDYLEEFGLKEFPPNKNFLRKWSGDKYPEDLGKKKTKNVLIDSYTYRSKFVHVGEQPPHTELSGQIRFFEVLRGIDKETLLPTHELLLGIAKYGTINWLKEKYET